MNHGIFFRMSPWKKPKHKKKALVRIYQQQMNVVANEKQTNVLGVDVLMYSVGK
jgi:hypothetical protein